MSTEKPIGQKVAEALTDRLEQITKANGYRTNAGEHVYRGKTAIDDAVLQHVVLFELDDSGTMKPGNLSAVRKTTQRFAVEGGGVCDADDPNDVGHDLVADVKRALFGPKDPTLGGITSDLRYVGKSFDPRKFGSDRIAATIEIEVDYVEDLANP